MSETRKTLEVMKITRAERGAVEDEVTREVPVTVFLNGQELVTLLASPAYLKDLAVGFLLSEGLLDEPQDLRSVVLYERQGVVNVETSDEKEIPEGFFEKRTITSGCGKGTAFYSPLDVFKPHRVRSNALFSADTILGLMRKLNGQSELFRATGGVHSCGLCDHSDILVFREDIGRHNALDKVFGECFLKGIPTADKMVLTSGRITSEVLLKVARREVPLIASKSAPTDLAVGLALKTGVTVVGFVRGSRMNVYTHSQRVS